MIALADAGSLVSEAKPVPSFPAFSCTSGGVVLGKRGKPLKPKSQGNYLVVSYVWRGIAVRNKYVHRLVAETWVPNPDDLPAVNHRDGDKSNNCAHNLEWVSAKENTQHAIDTGLLTNLPTKGQCGFQRKEAS